jgi:hypothetical protein
MLVLQHERIDHDRVARGIEFGPRMKLRDPASKDIVGGHHLTGLVVDLDRDVLAKILGRYIRAYPGRSLKVRHRARPLLEGHVVGDTALERDRPVIILARI